MRISAGDGPAPWVRRLSTSWVRRLSTSWVRRLSAAAAVLVVAALGSVAVAALTKKLESGNQELGGLKREEQAVESLVADLARMMQDFPTDPSQSFDRMRGKLPWPVSGRVSAHYQAPRENSGGVR